VGFTYLKLQMELFAGKILYVQFSVSGLLLDLTGLG